MSKLAFSSHTPNPSSGIDHLVGLDNGDGQGVLVCIGSDQTFVNVDETDHWPESYGGFEGFNQRAVAYAAALQLCREFEEEVTRFVASVEAA
jgi:hypothetical protein